MLGPGGDCWVQTGTSNLPSNLQHEEKFCVFLWKQDYHRGAGLLLTEKRQWRCWKLGWKELRKGWPSLPPGWEASLCPRGWAGPSGCKAPIHWAVEDLCLGTEMVPGVEVPKGAVEASAWGDPWEHRQLWLANLLPSLPFLLALLSTVSM